MPLLGLANELLKEISEHLEFERDINAFARTCGHLYYLLNTYLYRHNIQHSESSALLWAAKRGQEATIRKLLAEKTDIRAKAQSLLLAAKHRHQKVVELLAKNVDPNTRDKSGRTP